MNSPRKPPRRGNSFSGNGSWWWSGQAWLPAISPDRRWRFNGVAWTPAVQRAWAPRGVLVFGAGWLVLLAGWLIVAAAQLVADYPASPSSTQTGVVAVLAELALAATAGWGFILGRRRLWAWIWISVPVGMVIEMVFYGMAMLAVPGSNGEDQDTAASVGLVILTVPTALLLLGLLWLGAGASRFRIAKGGVAVIATALVLRVTTGPRNGYDVVFSLGTLLLILGAFLAGWATRRQHLK